ncbi:MAG: carboxypeptidase-like regulatory domain-containing protein [Arenimonas sp.]|uniref:carboxypeptidase-like regulatory domain-containing protein n=1 Tax=Arenimonas sp. TaxID=1872635 RepID=UPI0025C5C09E|nr:carboxypeptidase-like regulatory domain-containing protein [Arenimonas sp.]MBW8368260.1 carboxypeptidase-like regulatory domain-containing protein [Arenimonas sp.]
MSNALVVALFLFAIAMAAWRRHHQRTVVSGVVVDSASGRPLPGLRVELHPGRGPEEFVAVPTDTPLEVVTSDHEGRFRFGPVSPRAEFILATRAGPGVVAGGGYLRLGRGGRRQKLRLGHIPRA